MELTRGDVFRICLQNYSKAYSRMMNTENRTMHWRKASELEGVLKVSGDLFSVSWKEIEADFRKCFAFVDINADYCVVPADLCDKYGLNDLKEAIHGQ